MEPLEPRPPHQGVRLSKHPRQVVERRADGEGRDPERVAILVREHLLPRTSETDEHDGGPDARIRSTSSCFSSVDVRRNFDGSDPAITSDGNRCRRATTSRSSTICVLP